MADDTARIRSRREPPPLRPVTVQRRTELSPRLLRLTLEGEGIAALRPAEPAASVRLLVPTPGTDELVMPTWNGNEFLLPDGRRPALRTFTPLDADAGPDRLDLAVVRHPGGAVSEWAEAVAPGAPAALSGPGRGWELDAAARRIVLLGDETALPAIDQLLGMLDPALAVEAHLEAITADAEIALTPRPGATVTWHVRGDGEAPGAALVRVAGTIDTDDDGVHVWAGGEAASMQAMRTVLLKEGGLPRGRASIRGYWKPARATEE